MGTLKRRDGATHWYTTVRSGAALISRPFAPRVRRRPQRFLWRASRRAPAGKVNRKNRPKESVGLWVSRPTRPGSGDGGGTGRRSDRSRRGRGRGRGRRGEERRGDGRDDVGNGFESLPFRPGSFLRLKVKIRLKGRRPSFGKVRKKGIIVFASLNVILLTRL